MRDYPKIGLYDSAVTLSGSDLTFSVEWEPIETVHELSGITKRYLKGYRLKTSVAAKFIPAAIVELLRAAYDSGMAGSQLYFFPYPDSYPSSFYKVEWMNGWRLAPLGALVSAGCAGSIELRGSEVLASPPAWRA